MEKYRFEFKSITATEAAEKMELWKENTGRYLEEMLDQDALNLRKDLLDAYEENASQQKYKTDLKFGLALYKILNQYGLSIYDASKDGMWRYLSLCVVPDIIAKRWSVGADIRFYKESNRIYLKSLWRYIFLSWQGNYEETYKILKDNSTDQILNLVDRSGRKGYFTELYRVIMKLFYCAKQKNSKIGDQEFRKVMALHTALCINIEPNLYAGGVQGYGKMLFERQNIKL